MDKIIIKDINLLSKEELNKLIEQLQDGYTDILFNESRLKALKLSELIGYLIDLHYFKFISKNGRTLNEELN